MNEASRNVNADIPANKRLAAALFGDSELYAAIIAIRFTFDRENVDFAASWGTPSLNQAS
jgi:hypothetical protein